MQQQQKKLKCFHFSLQILAHNVLRADQSYKNVFMKITISKFSDISLFSMTMQIVNLKAMEIHRSKGICNLGLSYKLVYYAVEGKTIIHKWNICAKIFIFHYINKRLFLLVQIGFIYIKSSLQCIDSCPSLHSLMKIRCFNIISKLYYYNFIL